MQKNRILKIRLTDEDLDKLDSIIQYLTLTEYQDIDRSKYIRSYINNAYNIIIGNKNISIDDIKYICTSPENKRCDYNKNLQCEQCPDYKINIFQERI